MPVAEMLGQNDAWQEFINWCAFFAFNATMSKSWPTIRLG